MRTSWDRSRVRAAASTRLHTRAPQSPIAPLPSRPGSAEELGSRLTAELAETARLRSREHGASFGEAGCVSPRKPLWPPAPPASPVSRATATVLRELR